MDMTQRNVLVVVGIGSVFSARHFYKTAKLWPFRLSVLTAWPAIGVAIMDTVIGNYQPKNMPVNNLTAEQGEALAAARQNNAAFVERMKHVSKDAEKQW